jgi:hypothetical protein
MTRPWLIILGFAHLACVNSAGGGITLAVSPRQIAVGPALDLGTAWYPDGQSHSIPNSASAAGVRLDFATLIPIHRFDERPRTGVSQVGGGTFNYVSSTIPALGGGFSYRVAPWSDNEPASRFGIFASGTGVVTPSEPMHEGLHEGLWSVFAVIRVTAPCWKAEADSVASSQRPSERGPSPRAAAEPQTAASRQGTRGSAGRSG